MALGWMQMTQPSLLSGSGQYQRSMNMTSKFLRELVADARQNSSQRGRS
jgi:hypothetical protein